MESPIEDRVVVESKAPGIPAPSPGGKETTAGPANYRCTPAVCRCAPGLELFFLFPRDTDCTEQWS